MKTIVLANLKQVFETIMTLCNILQLRVTSYNEKIAMYVDVFDENKIILLNKEYSEVFYHDYTNDIHVCYEINNSDKLFIEWYERYNNSNDIIAKLNEVIDQLEKDKSNLYEEIENIRNENIEEIDYLNERIETLKNCNYRMCNDLGDCENEISQLNNIISDRDMVINTMKKTITEKETLINSLYNQISHTQLNYQNKLNESKEKYDTLFSEWTKEYDEYTETIKANEQLKNDIASYKQQIEEMTKQNNYLHKKIRKMMK